MNKIEPKANTTSKSGASGTEIKTVATWGSVILPPGVILIVAAIAGIAVYRNRFAPFNTVVLEVNDVQIRMHYFLKRAAMSGEPAMNMLQVLTREQMIKLAAEAPPFNITVSEEDIDRFARELAG